MKLATPLLLICLLATAGCVTTSPAGLAGPAAKDEPQAAPAARKPAPAPAVQAKDAAPAAAAGTRAAVAPAGPPPDAIIKLNPGSDRLTQEMEARLAAIAAKAREDDRTMLRLESYVPGGGSPSLNLVRAEQSLQLIKKRLVDLDVNPRRILLAPFGEEYATERDERRYWVEIYLIRPRL
jgi:hypothetical protein